MMVQRQQIELIAKNDFIKDDNQDPIDCSVLYLALGRQRAWHSMWKLTPMHPEQSKMLKFLENDFTQERWSSAACKNAFALLGKQRYSILPFFRKGVNHHAQQRHVEYAAAFFLLAGKMNDAVSICQKYLQDPQLALCLCRLMDGDHSARFSTLLAQSVPKEDAFLHSVALAWQRLHVEAALVLMVILLRSPCCWDQMTQK